jgi:hypothetical protein
MRLEAGVELEGITPAMGLRRRGLASMFENK